MTKKLKGRIIGILVVAFITTNALLIYFDDQQDVERKSYIEEWTQSFTYDLYERLHTNGVFASTEADFVYFDESIGTFEEFLVKEGQAVQEGDDLYSYTVTDYEEQTSALEGKIDVLEEEVNAIEDYIDELEDYDIPDPDSSSSSSLFDEDEKSDQNQGASTTAQTEFLKEQKIAEAEAELEKTEAVLEMVEDQLDQLESDGEIITVTSTFSGVITELSQDLDAPLLTLKSLALHVEGELTEDQRQRVEEGLVATVTIPELEVELPGQLTAVRSFPDQVGVDSSSFYPYEVTLEESNEELLPGYHADVEIIVNQALEVVTAFEEALVTEKDLYAWVMTDEGTLERRAVTSGLEEKGMVAVTDGLAAGEWLALDPRDEFRKEAVFLTPIDLENMPTEELLDTEFGNWEQPFLNGLVSR